MFFLFTPIYFTVERLSFCQDNTFFFLFLTDKSWNHSVCVCCDSFDLYLVPIHSPFLKNRPLANSFIELQCESVCLSPFHVTFFEASHWPSGHMISSRPLIKSFLAPLLLSVCRIFIVLKGCLIFIVPGGSMI